MVSITTAQQNEVAKVFEEAMRKTAASFSKWLDAEVTWERVQLYAAIADSKIYPCFKSGQDLTVIVTPLLGDLPGRSYFVLDRQDLDGLFSCKPFRKIPRSDEDYMTAILKETDNILSAAFITVLSNTLKLSVFGDVPEKHDLPVQVINDVIQMYIPNGPVSIVAESSFKLKGNSTFSPQFIWKLSAERIYSALAQRPSSIHS